MRVTLRSGHRGSSSTARGPLYAIICCVNSSALIGLVVGVFLATKAEAQFAAQFSLAVGEEFNDNIFFTKQREHDFITRITPTLSFRFQPTTAPAHVLNFDFSPEGEIFARNRDLNNFGENLTLNAVHNYDYSPRLTLRLSDSLQRWGDSRTTGFGGQREIRQSPTPTQPPIPGLTRSQALADFISDGATLSNYFSIQGRFLYAPDITLSGEYNTAYTAFLDVGGNELSNEFTMRGIYNWRQEHNLHAGYSINIIKTRDGDNNVVHNIDIGDDYFSNTKIELTPTLTLAFSTGLSFNAGDDGPRIANNSALNLTKVWEKATFIIGGRKGLTGSHGIAGISDTTTFFTTFNIRLTERVSANIGADYSLFDTDDVKFNTLQANAGLQYVITSWLCSGLNYTHRRRDSGSGSRNTDLLTRGNVYSNSAVIMFSAHFDVWPSIGLAKSPRSCLGNLQPIAAPQSPSLPQ